MTDFIERIARAIAEYHDEDPDAINPMSQLLGKSLPQWRKYATVAVAVLEAIREPTGEMLGEAHDTLLYHVKGEEIETARTVWARMIEAELPEGHAPAAPGTGTFRYTSLPGT